MRAIIVITSIITLAFASANASTLPLTANSITSVDTMPRVFQLSDNNGDFQQLEIDYEYQLLTACNDDLDVAFGHWMNMMHDMEKHSEAIGYDLKGIKVWLYVFWEKNGVIRHIGYYLKPNSRNVKPEELNTFFASFIKSYKFPVTATRRFSHYGSASFPTLPQRVQDK